MTQATGAAGGRTGSLASLRGLGDLASAARYSAENVLGDFGATARMHVKARLELARGRPEAALLRYGAGVRHVKQARQSIATYRAIDRLIARYPEHLAAYRPDEATPDRFVFFIGYSRSGHSLVGSLIDAHPNALVSHELHALNLLRQGVPLDEVLRAIRHNSAFFTRFGRGYMGYSYEVASQSQGAVSDLKVIGDKKANGTTGVLRRDPGLVDRMLTTLPAPFTFVHVIRDPFDNIAARAKRVGTSYDLATYGYFVNVAVNADLKRRHPDLVVDVHLDDLTADPVGELTRLMTALGLGDRLTDAYLADCAKLVFPDARRRRDEIDWPAGVEADIRQRLAGFDFMRRYAESD